jgi:uncharacterized protein (DUF58 family)
MKRRMPFSGRLLRVLGAIGLLSLAGILQASATTATGSQNPDFTVFVSLTPDAAAAGTAVTQTYAVTNNTQDVLVAVVTGRLMSPNGMASPDPVIAALRPGEALNRTLTYAIDQDSPAGVYELTLSVTNAHGTSHATASFTVN